MVAQNSLQQTLNWYVAYTYPQAEKKVDRLLCEKGIISFLPLQKVIRQWSDRKKKLEIPLFPNYIFLRATEVQRLEALRIKELVKYICFEGRPVTLDESEITTIKKSLLGEVVRESDINFGFEQGKEVEITSGKFCGLKGVLIRKNKKDRLLIQITCINQVLSIDISSCCVKRIG